jgi:TonB family protein
MASGYTVNTPSLLEQELAPLKARIEQARGRLTELNAEIFGVEAELETFSADRLRFDALREACSLLDRLDQLEAGQLFWGESPEIKDPAGHMERLRSRIACFDEKIGGILEKQAHLKVQANQRLDEIDYLYDQIDEVYDRDERRNSEFAIVRELSAVPHESVMPWSAETDERFRRNQLIALLLSLLLGIAIHMVTVPKAVRPVIAKIPERLAMMVREEPRRPEPAKKAKEEQKEKKKEEKAGEKKVAKNEEPPPTQTAPARAKVEPVEQTAAPKRSQNTGVLAFKEAFKDLLDETNAPRLGTEARLSNNANQAGNAVSSRSLVSMNGSGGSGGIGAFSRNVGSGGIGSAAVGRAGGGGGNGARIGRGGNGVGQVKSTIAGAGGNGDAAKPLTAGGKPSRTDEEIQILFDRYKAALYRIYNTELRKDPTLRGKMVLRITIEPSGAVSACSVASCNMNAPDFNAQIVERVKKFNFGPKDGVPKTTILYPIDFLPAR